MTKLIATGALFIALAVLSASRTHTRFSGWLCFSESPTKEHCQLVSAELNGDTLSVSPVVNDPYPSISGELSAQD